MAMNAIKTKQTAIREGDAACIELENGAAIPQRNGRYHVRVYLMEGASAIICQRGSEDPYPFPSLQAALACLKTMNH